ncbi:LysR family transcriptional regulator [Sphingobium sp. CR2-8]|uniref:LysR family transcriptional regulator n=1 Tax=Sphingobium sp. CR2-8 TaxID=1306534 RepID=UPI002DBA84F3|nr:LysR family transcriptional regulator [Sphingobium sp. CR2-8]MEC3909571.1 LysR family transcriptional regulator [Sphingobium sp. CR2-8]
MLDTLSLSFVHGVRERAVRIMNLEWLEDFIALMKERNFSRAAQRRNVTQPAFSRRVHSLEDWIGSPLFIRSPQGVQLSVAGEAFSATAEAVVRDLYRAKAGALEAAGRAETTLPLAATHALSFTFFPEWIRLHAPHETLNLMSDSMEACEQMMLRGDASFLLHHSHPSVETALNPRQFRTVKVGEDVLIPVCRPRTDGTPIWLLGDGQDETPFPHLAYSNPSGLGRILKADWAQKGHRFLPAVVMTSRLAAALLTMARDGHGVAWLPKSLANADITGGTLVEAGESICTTVVDIALTRPVARLNSSSERFWQTFL